MVRSKVKYEFITDDRARRETYKKRKGGFLKKLSELKTLCNIDACAILMSDDETQPELWPSPDEASRIVEKFRSLPPAARQNNMTDQVGFLKHNISRLTTNLEKENKQIRSLEMELCLIEFLNKGEVDVASPDDINDMLRILERKIQLVDRRIAEVGPSSSTMTQGEESNNESPCGKGKQPL